MYVYSWILHKVNVIFNSKVNQGSKKHDKPVHEGRWTALAMISTEVINHPYKTITERFVRYQTSPN